MENVEPTKKSHGALIGSIIIIIILIIGGIYALQSRVKINKQNKLMQEKILNKEITPEDTADLNNLEQELNTVDTNTGVDVEKIQ